MIEVRLNEKINILWEYAEDIRRVGRYKFIPENWLKDNNIKFKFKQLTIIFENEADATLFKLFWL